MPQSKPSALERRIKSRRLKNTDGKYFITLEALSAEVKEADVRAALREIDWPAERLNEATDKVMNGGVKTFAILYTHGELDQLQRFIENDQLQRNSQLDQKLPLQIADLQMLFDAPADAKIRIEGLQKQAHRSAVEEEELERLLDVTHRANEVHDGQFEYCVPSFQQNLSHRRLDTYIRLPFTSQVDCGEGAYGRVYMVTLPALQFGSPEDKEIQIVRKELKLKGANYEREVKVLEILRLIKHPNILELYCSYTQSSHTGTDQHSLLFPLAGGHVGELLERERKQCPAPFNSALDDVFYSAICGLTSGLANIHHFRDEVLDLEAICCHHDLKLENILFVDSRFILADFGIASVKTLEESSKTESKGGGGFFAAPENRDYRAEKNLRVGRASDIWALGSILAVILTYLKLGPAGVDEFEKKRESLPLDAPYGYYAPMFHLGPMKPNPAVPEWLDNLRLSCEPGSAEEAVIDLVRDMLRLEHLERPPIRDVLTRLRFITLRKISKTVLKLIAEVPALYKQKLAFEIERTTLQMLFKELEKLSPPPIFKEWFSDPSTAPSLSPGTVGANTITSSRNSSFAGGLLLSEHSDAGFNTLSRILGDIVGELVTLNNQSSESEPRNPALHPVFLPLQRLTQQLLSNLPRDVQQSVRDQTEVLILAELGKAESGIKADMEAELRDESSSSDSAYAPRILQLLNMRLMKHQTETLLKPELRLEISSLRDSATRLPVIDKVPFLTFDIRRLVVAQNVNVNVDGSGSGKTTPDRDVIVETLTYGEDIQDENAAGQVFERMVSILQRSHSRQGAGLRGLLCSGIYRDRNTFGLVYEIPLPDRDNSDMSCRQRTGAGGGGGSAPTTFVATLAQLIAMPKLLSLVALNDRFRLALDLSTALLEFHKIGWLHRGMSSHNVIFTSSYSSASSDGAETWETSFRKLQTGPFITGFAHSRPDEVGQFSNLTATTRELESLRDYLHPRYRGKEGTERFSVKYDYYSLGVVLLEIGLWKPLAGMIGKWNENARTKQKKDKSFKLNSEEVRRELVATARRVLPATMGEKYSQAVVACLSDELESGKNKDEDVSLKFEQLVLRVLGSCHV